MAQVRKKLLVVQSKAPFGSSAIQESLDIILAAGTFDQDVSLLIEEDACFQLLNAQQPEIIQRKNTTKMLKALPIYGIDKILISADCASARGLILNENDIFQLVSKNEIKNLYNESDIVLRF